MGRMSELARHLEEYKAEQLEEMQNHYMELEKELHYLEQSRESLDNKIYNIEDELEEKQEEMTDLADMTVEELAAELEFKEFRNKV
jgi:peptidoglycan hydrolase CwlO-like protein